MEKLKCSRCSEQIKKAYPAIDSNNKKLILCYECAMISMLSDMSANVKKLVKADPLKWG